MWSSYPSPLRHLTTTQFHNLVTSDHPTTSPFNFVLLHYPVRNSTPLSVPEAEARCASEHLPAQRIMAINSPARVNTWPTIRLLKGHLRRASS